VSLPPGVSLGDPHVSPRAGSGLGAGAGGCPADVLILGPMNFGGDVGQWQGVLAPAAHSPDRSAAPIGFAGGWWAAALSMAVVDRRRGGAAAPCKLRLRRVPLPVTPLPHNVTLPPTASAGPVGSLLSLPKGSQPRSFASVDYVVRNGSCTGVVLQSFGDTFYAAGNPIDVSKGDRPTPMQGLAPWPATMGATSQQGDYLLAMNAQGGACTIELARQPDRTISATLGGGWVAIGRVSAGTTLIVDVSMNLTSAPPLTADIEFALSGSTLETCAGAAGGYLYPDGPAPIASVARLGLLHRSTTVGVILMPPPPPNATAVGFFQIDTGACTLRVRAKPSQNPPPPPTAAHAEAGADALTSA
jgi:hypothetical protein